MKGKIYAFGLLLALSLPPGCRPNEELIIPDARPYQSQKAVIVVIDGPRYTESWGKPENIPFQAQQLKAQGTFFSNFFNQGHTYTVAGHTAISTGYYQLPNNDGTEIPLKPSIFQHYLSQTQLPPTKACIITSKQKLEVLSDCRLPEFRSQYTPAYSCGKAELGDRSDRETLDQALQALETDKPNLMLVQFSGPDKYAHRADYPAYIRAIQQTDSLVHELWLALQANPAYHQQTALLITNDHGRHADGHRDGFKSHGDNCRSCRHISLLALGPDFPAGRTVSESYGQTDIVPTLAHLLKIRVPQADGRPIKPLLGYEN